MSSTTKGAKLGLVRNRVRGLIRSSFFSMYILTSVTLIIIIAVMLISFWSNLDVSLGGLWRFIAPILSVIVFSPVAYKLWAYRTTDKETEEVDRAAQANLAYYSEGIRLVTSSDGFQKAIGINLLIRVSEQTQKYNEEIKYIFIETLKKPPEGAGDSYAQSIIKWLYQRYYNEGMSLHVPTATLHIKSQVFDLTDEDCRKGLMWLLLLATHRLDTPINFTDSVISYKTFSHRLNSDTEDRTLLRGSFGSVVVMKLINSIESRIASSDPQDPYHWEMASELRILLDELKKDQVEIEEKLSTYDKEHSG